MNRRVNLLTILIPLFIGGMIVYNVTPYVVAAFRHLPVNPIWDKVILKQPVKASARQELYDTQQSVLSLRPSGKGFERQAITEMAMARSLALDNVKKIKFYQKAEISVQEGLLKRPSNPYSWARLAYLRLTIKGLAGDVARPLMMSVLLGPHERPLVLARVNYALLIWDKLSPEDQAIMRRQITAADRIDRQHLIKLARYSRKSQGIIVQAMAEDKARFLPFFKALIRRKG